jgi:hypothetical protein
MDIAGLIGIFATIVVLLFIVAAYDASHWKD